MNKYTDIDSYISDFPEETQKKLKEMRKTIANAAPEAEEVISYGMPTFTLKGNLVHFAGYKNHIGFYPAPSGIETFRDALSVYKFAKGSVQFPLDQPLPLELISKIVKFRANQNTEKAQLKFKKKSAPKSSKLSDSEQVTQHIQNLDTALAAPIEYIRQIILKTDKEIGEQIKWNSPSFYYTGEMKPFDAKEYKRDIVVLNLHRGKILLVFPTGAKIKDATGFLEGDYQDGRRVVNFIDINDIKSKKKALRQVIKAWLQLVEK